MQLNVKQHAHDHLQQDRLFGYVSTEEGIPVDHPSIDGCTTRHAGYAISLRKGPQVEEPFDWVKAFGGTRKTRFNNEMREVLRKGASYATHRMGCEKIVRISSDFSALRPASPARLLSCACRFHNTGKQFCLVDRRSNNAPF